MQLVMTTLVCFLVSVVTVFCVESCKTAQGDTGKVYSMRYGQAYCTNARWSHCGLELSGCTDGRVYYCMTDVAVKE